MRVSQFSPDARQAAAETAEKELDALVAQLQHCSEHVLQMYMGHAVVVVRNLDPETTLVLVGMALAYRGDHPAALAVQKRLAEDRRRWCEGRRAMILNDLESSKT